jgi:phosphohistidine phosphatase
MKTLYLIRHAKSSWEDHILSDHDRPLSDRGRRDAPIIADILKPQKVMPDLIISSTARRALKTAKIFSSILKYPTDNIIQDATIYDATSQNLFTVINKIDDKMDTVMIFGHNPGFTMLANLLGDKAIDNMPTCASAKFELNVNSWKDVEVGCGKLIEFEYPKKHSY